MTWTKFLPPMKPINQQNIYTNIYDVVVNACGTAFLRLFWCIAFLQSWQISVDTWLSDEPYLNLGLICIVFACMHHKEIRSSRQVFTAVMRTMLFYMALLCHSLDQKITARLLINTTYIDSAAFYPMILHLIHFINDKRYVIVFSLESQK